MGAGHLWYSERVPKRLLYLLHRVLDQKMHLSGDGVAFVPPMQANIREQSHPSNPQISARQSPSALSSLQQRLQANLQLLRDRNPPKRVLIQK